MAYVNINTLERVEAIDIRLSNPESSFPSRKWSDEELEPYGYAILHEISEYPVTSTYEKLEEASPKKIDGKWYFQYSVVAMDEEEKKQKDQQIIDDIINSTQATLDSFAKTRRYDNMFSLTTYSTSTDPTFQQEGQRGVELRDATWKKLYEIFGEVEAGTRPMPTGFYDIHSELPELTW